VTSDAFHLVNSTWGLRLQKVLCFRRSGSSIVSLVSGEERKSKDRRTRTASGRDTNDLERF
jgi:hypothetical protein